MAKGIYAYDWEAFLDTQMQDSENKLKIQNVWSCVFNCVWNILLKKFPENEKFML